MGETVKDIVSAFMVTVILVGTLVMAFDTRLVKASGTIYIRADGSIDPPTAPISSVDNITYTFADNIINDSIVVERDNIVIDGAGYMLQGSGNGKGIALYGRSYVTIRNVKITSFDEGLYLEQCSHVYVQANTITGNDWDNIQTRASIHNVFSGNSLTASNGDGLWMRWSSNYNNVTANNIVGNGGAAVSFEFGSDYNVVYANNMINNTYGPLFVSSSTHNEVFENLILGSQWSAIYIHTSSNNTFYHNNLINNTRQVYTYDSTDIWDDGCEGNYWIDYNGTDLDGDGVGDTSLPWLGVDSCPLTNPYWIPADVNHDLEVGIYDVVKITGAYGCIPSDPYWNPHADIAEPYGKIDILDVVTCTKCYGTQFTGFPPNLPPPPNARETAIQVYAYDLNDAYSRTWDLVFDRPMPPPGDGGVHWGADVIEAHFSGYIMIVQWNLAPGDHYLIFGITQTGGPEYGVYNGTLTINGNSFSFSGLYGNLTVTIEFSV